MDFCTAFDGHCILCARQYTAQYANGIPMGTRGPAAFSSGPPFDSLPFVCFVGLFLSLIACLLSEDSFDFFFCKSLWEFRARVFKYFSLSFYRWHERSVGWGCLKMKGELEGFFRDAQ